MLRKSTPGDGLMGTWAQVTSSFGLETNVFCFRRQAIKTKCRKYVIVCLMYFHVSLQHLQLEGTSLEMFFWWDMDDDVQVGETLASDEDVGTR